MRHIFVYYFPPMFIRSSSLVYDHIPFLVLHWSIHSYQMHASMLGLTGFYAPIENFSTLSLYPTCMREVYNFCHHMNVTSQMPVFLSIKVSIFTFILVAVYLVLHMTIVEHLLFFLYFYAFFMHHRSIMSDQMHVCMPDLTGLYAIVQSSLHQYIILHIHSNVGMVVSWLLLCHGQVNTLRAGFFGIKVVFFMLWPLQRDIICCLSLTMLL